MHHLNIMLGKGLGGLEQVAIDYQTALSANGVAITTLLRQGAQISPPAGQEQAYQHLAVSPIPWLTQRRFNAIIKDLQPTTLLLHGNRPLKLFGKKQFNMPKTNPCKRIFIAHNYRTKPLVHNMDGVIAVSSPVKDHIANQGYPAHKIHVVNNMTKMQKVTRQPMRENTPVIGMLTRLHPVKGVDLFIKVLHQLHQDGQNFKAKIAGDGPERNTLENLVSTYGLQEKIEFLGWVNDKANFFSAVDILAAPSRSEAFPVTIVEAVSAGIPLVLSDLKGPCSVLTQGKDALIVPVENSTALENALKQLINSPELRQSMLTAQEQLAINFTEQNVAQKLQTAIQNICQT